MADSRAQVPSTTSRVSTVLSLFLRPSICLLIDFIAGFTLLGLHISGWKSSQGFASFVDTSRASVVQTVVQILSTLLGLLQYSVLCLMVQSSFRTYISSKMVSLHSFQFINAATTPRISLTQPWVVSATTILVVIASLLPGAAWSGALTPIVTERVFNTSVSIPSFVTDNSSTRWIGDLSTSSMGSGEYGQWITDKGLFSFDPSSLRGTILQAASDASASKSTNATHPKLDKSGFAYLGRSYGMGSAAGLSLPNATNAYVQWLSYNEPGFYSNVSCWHNETSAFRLDNVASFKMTNRTIHLFNTTGFQGDGTPIEETALVGRKTQDMFAWTLTNPRNSPTLSIIMSIATYPNDEDSWGFNKFDKTFCHIDFVPKSFHVKVNNTDRTILATPREDTVWPSYSKDVLNQIQWWIGSFSNTQGMFAGSILGRNLRLNVNQLMNSTAAPDSGTFYEGIGDFIASCIDDVHVALLSVRLEGGAVDATAPVEATVAVPAAIIGDRRYIIVVLVLNFVILVIYVAEAIRMHGWRDMSNLDIMDLSSVILGALKGGMTIKSEAVGAFEGDLKVRLSDLASESPRIVPVNARESSKQHTSPTRSPQLHYHLVSS